MRRIFPAFLTLILFTILFTLPLDAQTGKEAPARSPERIDPIDVNLIIDGSRYMQNAGQRALAWICDEFLDREVREGDYLRIWIAADQVSVLYQGLLAADNRDAVKDLIRKSIPLSAGADFGGALRAAQGAGASGNRSPVMTYTLLVSSPAGLSPAHIGDALPYLRYSRVLEFPGWRALVIALDIGRQVREAADSFLSNR